MVTQPPTAARVGGLGGSRRLLFALAVVVASLLLGVDALTAQESQPETVSCPLVPGYEPPASDVEITDFYNPEFFGDCFYSPTNPLRSPRSVPVASL